MKTLRLILILALLGCATRKAAVPRSIEKHAPFRRLETPEVRGGNREGVSGGPIHRSAFPGRDARALHAAVNRPPNGLTGHRIPTRCHLAPLSRNLTITSLLRQDKRRADERAAENTRSPA